MEAKLYSKNSDKSVDCFLCRHRCHVSSGKRGICNVRKNDGGIFYSVFYGKPVAMAIDPIEKKPLYHFLPGSKSFSIATVGCNFQCPFCQNWDISQYGRFDAGSRKPEAGIVEPFVVARNAFENGCKTIAYTYSEPTVFFEYAHDIAKEAEQYGIKNIFVTNGFMTREMLDAFHPMLHAANVDLKGFNKEVYKKEMKADLDGVLDSIAYMKELGIWVEITTLIVPGMNDSKNELKNIAEFIAGVGKDVPWHISRFHPMYKKTETPPTPYEALETAYETGKKAGLRYVYLGNVCAGEMEDTSCYSCGRKLIKRSGFVVEKNNIKDAKCFNCGTTVDGIF